MISVLARPTDQIGVEDIQELIDSVVPEGEQIEFKRSLRTRGDGRPDRWLTDGGEIGDRARNEILEEAVAFANAYGGALLLGIRESDAKPPVAVDITPIPQCVELAERLRHQFRDCVDPEISRIDIFAVPIQGDDGVVIIRTGRSRMAPHRVKPTLVCPIRRADRCEGMSMREIQDLTLNLSRGLERLERRLTERTEKFQREFERLSNPDNAFGIRATAVPVGGEIMFDRVYGQSELYRPLFEVSCFGAISRIDANDPSLWRPMLRLARAESGSSRREFRHSYSYEELHCDGLVESARLSCDGALYPSHAIAEFAAIALWADHVRTAASSPASEYAIDVEIYGNGQDISVRAGHNYRRFAHMFVTDELGKIEEGRTSFPRYSLLDSGSIPRLAKRFEQDLWDLIGKDVYEIDFRLEEHEGIPRLLLERDAQS